MRYKEKEFRFGKPTGRTWKNGQNDLEIELPIIDRHSTNNGHLFYLICKSEAQRASIIEYLGENGILAVSHYISLHASPYYAASNDPGDLPNSEKFTDRLIRLPLFFELDIEKAIKKITSYKNGK